jgi:RNA polymerase sigma-70 factor (ECF subfamily)
MHKDCDYTELVKQAQLGNRESLDRLAAVAGERLYEHVYRITLQSNLAQDIVQESMVEMFKILGNLKKADGFWPWLCGIAFNKIRHHQRRQRRQKTVGLPEGGYEVFSKDRQDGLADLISQELKQTVLTAMSKLRPRYRAILTMRCYDDMQYSKIAELMGCSEFAARMLFCRAKKALAKQLSRRGMGKGALLLALTLFGKMTATSKAAAAQISVPATALKAGTAAALAGVAVSKSAIVTVTAASVIAVGSMTLTGGTDKTGPISQGNRVQNFQPVPAVTGVTEDTEECWYYYPDGITKPVMTRSIRFGSGGQQRYCQWLQNDVGNYYYDKGRNIIYMKNHRMWNHDFSVCSQPIDNPQLSEFLAEVQGRKVEIEHVSGRGRGLFIAAQRDRGEAADRWRIVRHYNVLDEDYFRCDWPSGSKIIDERDSLHKQGWAYFRIEGEVADRKVSGLGRMPFVYETSKSYKPWLKLEVAGDVKISDFPDGASVCDSDGKVTAVYPAGSFFKGLARPWMGLHTIDTIRRDAAIQRLWFETKVDSKAAKSEVTIFANQGKIIYTIDMERDVIDKVTIELGGSGGQLRFSYISDIAEGDDKTSVKSHKYSGPSGRNEGLLWLLRLAGGDLGK